MVQVILFGKSDILGKVAWCRKYSAIKDEQERLKKAKLDITMNYSITGAAGDPTLDTHKIGPKLKELGFHFPVAADVDLLQSRLFKDIKIYALFDEVEIIPGKQEYEFGIGYKVETHNIFLEDAIHHQVEVTKQQAGKSMFGGKKEVKVTEKKLKTAKDLFGETFTSDKYLLMAAGRERDKKDNMRYGIRIQHNTKVTGEVYSPEKLEHKWENETKFFDILLKKVKEIELILNKTFTIIGYDTPPTYSLLLGEVTTERNISKFTKIPHGDGFIVNADYV